jgi:DNA-binding GntR family transcriptional regulator
MSSFERPKTAHEAVLQEIRQRMLDGRLGPGEAIRPDAVGAELGVSAVPVREALRILEGEGHVQNRPHRGYVVTDLDFNDLNEIYQIRGLLEDEAVRQAIPKLRSDDIAELRAIVAEMHEVGDDVTRLAAVNRRFHFTLFEAAEMRHLLRILRTLWDSSDRYRARYLMAPEHRDMVHEQHGRIMDAIAEGDIDKVIKEKALHRAHAIDTLAQQASHQEADA